MKKALIFFFLLTVVNLIIYWQRDRFQFIKYATSAELYGNCNQDCLNKWKSFLDPFPPSEATEAKKILQPLRLDTASTITRVKRIGQFIYSKFRRQSGSPSTLVSSSTPVRQFTILATDTVQKLWCGTYSQMFNYFCWSANIACRSIEIMRPGDHHLFNECYIPELGKWVFVDLTSGISLAEQGSSLLNVQEFLSCLQTEQPFQILQAESQKLQPIAEFDGKNSLLPYYSSSYPFVYYHKTDLNAVYNTGSKLKRYIIPDYWYEIFSSTKKFPLLFYIKLLFLLIWVILGSLILFKRLHD